MMPEDPRRHTVRPDDPEAPVRFWREGARVTDCSSSAASRTFRLDRPDGTFFLKEGPVDLLTREAAMSRWFYGLGWGPEVADMQTAGGRATLVTRALPGENGISPRHLASPGRLAEVFGAALRVVHELPSDGCPWADRLSEMRRDAGRNREAGVLAGYLAPEGLETARIRYGELSALAQADAVIHGDYCLPNIVLEECGPTGFVDLGNGGYGDSHYDLFWGLWTLEFNLKTKDHHRTFLEAYGSDRVDPDRLEFNRLLSAFLD